MAEDRVQTRIPAVLAAWLTDRAERMHTGSTDLQAREELGIWHMALAGELRRIRLTLSQINCIADVLNGTMISPGIAGSMPLVFAECSDAFQLARETPFPGESSYGAKWEIDEKTLLDYLRTLGPTADHALHDAVSRWWDADHEATIDGWAAVGLRIAPDHREADQEGGHLISSEPSTPRGTDA